MDKIADTAGRTLDATRDMVSAYLESDALNRRFLDQALFVCFRIHPGEEIEGVLREEVRLLTSRHTSRWLLAECHKAEVRGRDFQRGGNGVDETVFQPRS